MSLAEIKEKLVKAYNEEDWMLIEDLIDVLDTLVTIGEGDELSVIAAAVLGGTSLFGGKGTVVGSIIGALMIGVINNGLILMGLEYPQQLIARGSIIILAVAISESGKNKS